MDESLKARLIGAAVLVAMAVLLIPELLSGRKTAEPQPADPAAARGTRTFTIELNGGSSAGDPQSSTVAETPAPEVATDRLAVEPAAVDEAPRPVPEPEPVAATAAAPPVKPPPKPLVESTPAAAAATRGGWAVQVGAFGSASAAQRLVKDLDGAGYRAFVSPVTRSGKTLHRVRVGPEGGRDDANRLAERLKARGLPTAVVAND